MLPAERVRRMLFNLVIECVPFTDDEFAFVQDCLADQEVRFQLAEFLQAFSSPRCVVNEECLQMLGQLVRVVLDELWRTKENSSLKELNSVMHASQLLFTFKNEAQKLGSGTRSIKVYLSLYIDDHEIWQDVKIWRLCLQRLINLKFHDAVKN